MSAQHARHVVDVAFVVFVAHRVTVHLAVVASQARHHQRRIGAEQARELVMQHWSLVLTHVHEQTQLACDDFVEAGVYLALDSAQSLKQTVSIVVQECDRAKWQTKRSLQFATCKVLDSKLVDVVREMALVLAAEDGGRRSALDCRHEPDAGAVGVCVGVDGGATKASMKWCHSRSRRRARGSALTKNSTRRPARSELNAMTRQPCHSSWAAARRQTTSMQNITW